VNGIEMYYESHGSDVPLALDMAVSLYHQGDNIDRVIRTTCIERAAVFPWRPVCRRVRDWAHA
jgi:hypothetical protein